MILGSSRQPIPALRRPENMQGGKLDESGWQNLQ